jgi:hypothetical protein
VSEAAYGSEKKNEYLLGRDAEGTLDKHQLATAESGCRILHSRNISKVIEQQARMSRQRLLSFNQGSSLLTDKHRRGISSTLLNGQRAPQFQMVCCEHCGDTRKKLEFERKQLGAVLKEVDRRVQHYEMDPVNRLLDT